MWSTAGVDLNVDSKINRIRNDVKDRRNRLMLTNKETAEIIVQLSSLEVGREQNQGNASASVSGHSDSLSSPISPTDPSRWGYLQQKFTDIFGDLLPGFYHHRTIQDSPIGNAQESLDILTAIEDKLDASSVDRVPYFQLFHLIEHHTIPRSRALLPRKLGDIPSRYPCDTRNFPWGSVNGLRNDLDRDQYKHTGVLLVEVAEYTWRLSKKVKDMENTQNTSVQERFNSIEYAAMVAVIDAGYFMYRAPKADKMVRDGLRSIRRLVKRALSAMEKIDGQSSDPGVSEQLVSRLEKHLKRLPTGELVFSNKYLETMENKIDKEDDFNRGRPECNWTIDLPGITSQLETIGVYVVELPQEIDLSEFPVLGSGGFGKAYKVTVPSRFVFKNSTCTNSVTVAVKITELGDNETDNQGLQRFLREARTWHIGQRFKHGNILQLWAIWTHLNDMPLMVSPVCEGKSLHNYIRNNRGPSKQIDRFKLARDALDGLIFLHSMTNPGPIIHGDVKTDNILIRDGRAVLSDFGLSFLCNDVRGLTTEHRGNPHWLAPEVLQAKNEKRRIPLTKASDVYAFGCVLLETITCEFPFSGIDDIGKLHKRCNQLWRGLIPNARNIKPDFWNCLIKCWDLIPGCRPSARAVHCDVQRFINQLRYNTPSLTSIRRGMKQLNLKGHSCLTSKILRSSGGKTLRGPKVAAASSHMKSGKRGGRLRHSRF